MPAPDGGDDFVRVCGPCEGPGLLIVLFEEAVDRGLQIGDGPEDASLEPALCESGEEALDRVEPGSGRRREVECPSRIAFEPSADIGMLVGGVVVDDGVDRLPRRNLSFDDIEEADELLMAMALHVAADHRAVEDVHRGEQRRRSVPLVVVCHRSGAALLQRQSGLGAVQRLNLALLVDRQDDGVRGRIDIEPDDVAQFVDEARIVGQLELAHPVRLEAVLAPDTLNRADAEPRRLRHQQAGPVGRLARRFAKCQRDDALGGPGAQRWDARGTRLVAEQPVEPRLDKAFLPAPYAGLGLAGSPHDLVRADTIGRKQHDLGPPDLLLRRVAVTNQGFEPTNIGRRNRKGFSCAHHADSHAEIPEGIPSGIQLSGSIH